MEYYSIFYGMILTHSFQRLKRPPKLDFCMVKLIDMESGIVTKWPWKGLRRKPYFLIGKNSDNDLIIRRPLVSWFHATIVRDGGGYSIVGHSRYGTFYPLDKSNRASTLRERDILLGSNPPPAHEVPTWETESSAVVLSRAEARAEQHSSLVPNIPIYKDHAYADLEDLMPLTTLLGSKAGRRLVASWGKPLKDDTIIALPREEGGFTELLFRK